MADEESGLLATALGVVGRSPLAVVPPDSKARALLNTEVILKNGGDKIDMFRIITTDYTDIYDFDIFVVKPPPDVRELNYRSPPLLVITDLCLRCGKALTYLGYHRYTYIFEGDDGVDNLPSACLLHTGSATIEEGINIRCHLCIYIKSCLDAKGVPLEQINASNIEMCWQRESGKMMLSRINFAMIRRDRERSAQEYWNFLKLKPWHETEFGATRFGVTEKTPQPYTGAEQSRGQAIQWLSRCQANANGIHAQCNQEIRDWLPSRLLDVQGTLDTALLKLVIPAENPDLFASDKRYITLSHCWGRWGAVNLPVLNTKNLHERTTKGLDLLLLPQTFKDALVIAQWFQVRWLWIDSLCIMQDSVTDWEKESLMMHSVYKNALLNISADDAEDARSGCFRSRHQLSVYPLQLGLAGAGRSGIDWFWLTCDSKSLFERVLGAETASRAWIFQERQLSRRVLHFTSTEMIWECCARQARSKQPYFACETFPDGAPLESAFMNRPKFQSQSDLTDSSLADLHDTWDMLCKSYSEKSLTKATDKAVAISGLAQEFQARLPNDSYVAGLWRSTLPQSLLWSSRDESARINVDDFVAPSWSWLSIDGPIAVFEPYHSTHALADITNVSIDPVVSSEPTGSLRSASIEMQCYLRAVTVKPDYEAKPWFMMSVGGGQRHILSIDGLEQELKIGSEIGFSFDTSYSETCGPASLVVIPVVAAITVALFRMFYDPRPVTRTTRDIDTLAMAVDKLFRMINDTQQIQIETLRQLIAIAEVLLKMDEDLKRPEGNTSEISSSEHDDEDYEHLLKTQPYGWLTEQVDGIFKATMLDGNINSLELEVTKARLRNMARLMSLEKRKRDD
ncbi:hypothetical protein E8E14_005725 [Neopestalotiopsis sp. 37M]|nr:hypothetical protein E8E14_005725 [Neopestalotiopsis sp. 37M]